VTAAVTAAAAEAACTSAQCTRVSVCAHGQVQGQGVWVV